MVIALSEAASHNVVVWLFAVVAILGILLALRVLGALERRLMKRRAAKLGVTITEPATAASLHMRQGAPREDIPMLRGHVIEAHGNVDEITLVFADGREMCISGMAGPHFLHLFQMVDSTWNGQPCRQHQKVPLSGSAA